MLTSSLSCAWAKQTESVAGLTSVQARSSGSCPHVLLPESQTSKTLDQQTVDDLNFQMTAGNRRLRARVRSKNRYLKPSPVYIRTPQLYVLRMHAPASRKTHGPLDQNRLKIGTDNGRLGASHVTFRKQWPGRCPDSLGIVPPHQGVECTTPDLIDCGDAGSCGDIGS